MHIANPLATVYLEQEPYDYLFKTNARMRRRIQDVQRQHNLSFKRAIELLLIEALEARAHANSNV